MDTLKRIRENQGLTQKQLADSAGVAVQTVSRAENGDKVSRVSVARICKALGIRIEEVQGLNIVE